MENPGEIAWESAFEVGDPAIDAQHRGLLSVANSLIVAAGDPSAALSNLREQVQSHFDHEAALMRRVAYPGQFHHESEHGRLIDLLTVVGGDIIGGDWDLDSIRTFFRSWLIDHIVDYDAPMVRFARTAGAHGAERHED